MKLGSILLRLVFALVVLSVPVAGVWVASSLTAWANGPTWAAALAGLLLFPILPLAWDALASRRRKKRDSGSFLADLDRRRRAGVRLGLADRLLLRTLALNLAFLGGLAALAPRDVGLAVATRGDWMLDGVDAGWADRMGHQLLRAGDRLGFLVEATEHNPYAELSDTGPTEAPEVEQAATARFALALPDGVAASVEGVFPPDPRRGTLELELAPGPGSVRLAFDDGRKLHCTFDALDGDALALEDRDGWALVNGPSARSCLQLRAPDPTWRPALYLTARKRSNAVELARASAPADVLSDGVLLEGWIRDQGWLPAGLRLFFEDGPDGEPGAEHWVVDPPAVAPEQVRAVQVREPFLRVLLDDDGSDALCAATQANPWQKVVLVADGSVRGAAPDDSKEQCTGAVSVPLSGERPPPPVPEPGSGASPWPLPRVASPDLDALAAEDTETLALLGRWIREQAPDPWHRVKLVHDVVIDRIEYDGRSAETEHRAPQDADTVFRSGIGVCAGYANLMVALGEQADLEVVYVSGLARQEAKPDGGPHAWNAVRIDDQWYLLDATWDDSSSSEAYDTGYLLTPPEVFVLSHLPTDPAWQLLDVPVSRGDFVRQPLVRPGMVAAELRLLAPERSQITVSGAATLELHNPSELAVVVGWGDGATSRCDVAGARDLLATCRFPAPGAYDVRVFYEIGPGDFGHGATVQVLSR